ncbi:eukaryotic translation initiation factor 3 subunit F-2-like [Drosophila sulfurigaster albostrigata]|uniref:eukaryotic translation initiation factor 3 subunit F-2-like n=1 Tax=Drosophila sulfurigaster albostrigata TaxID=89887 RepID=UPI002D21C25B|nr:eukaryotic translation initiation factor 3 subunit F-2-like [Drosophila sulfurigaster albostrigata]
MSISNYKLQTNVRLHPVVLFQIISSYERRSKSTTMAVGTLLGRRDKGSDVIEITNSFTVQHKEHTVGDVEQFKLDTQYASEMYELNQITYPQEKILGWYGTGKCLSRSAAAMHAFYSRECGDFQPLHLLVDTTLRGGRMTTRLYCGVMLGVPGGTKGLMFTELPLFTIDTEGDESIALRTMQKYALNTTKHVGRMLPELVHVVDSLRELGVKLDLVLRYINDVLERKRRPDNSVGRALHDALTSVPMLDTESFRLMFNTNVRDMLLSITLSTMIKTQMQLTEKLSCLPDY